MKTCPGCGHEVGMWHDEDGCSMIVDESWDGEDEAVFYCDCELTPEDIFAQERDEARKAMAAILDDMPYQDRYSGEYILSEDKWHTRWCKHCGGEVAIIDNGFACKKCGEEW